MDKGKCPSSKGRRYILGIGVMPPRMLTLECPAIHLKTVKEGDTYILVGVLRFMMNADCSAHAVFIYG